MTRTHSSMSNDADSATAGAALGRDVRAAFGGEAPDAIIVFASSRHDYPALLQALQKESGCSMIAGSSSAGEFARGSRGEGAASAMALKSDTMKFALGIGRDVSQDPLQAARATASGFKGLDSRPLPYRAALVMTDALAGHADEVVEELTVATGGNYSFFGGGAGDDGRFAKTHVFAGTEAITDAVVALEIQSMQPIGVGVSHGWLPTQPGFRVTEASGGQLVSLNGAPAVDAFEEHARSTGQAFDRADPLPFFLHNIVGIKSDDGYRLRVPLAVNEDGSISCAAAVPVGSVVHIMATTAQSAVAGGRAGDARRARRARREPPAGRPGVRLRGHAVAPRGRRSTTSSRPARTCSPRPISPAATPMARSPAPKGSSAVSTTARRSSACFPSRRLRDHDARPPRRSGESFRPGRRGSAARGAPACRDGAALRQGPGGRRARACRRNGEDDPGRPGMASIPAALRRTRTPCRRGRHAAADDAARYGVCHSRHGTRVPRRGNRSRGVEGARAHAAAARCPAELGTARRTGHRRRRRGTPVRPAGTRARRGARTCTCREQPPERRTPRGGPSQERVPGHARARVAQSAGPGRHVDRRPAPHARARGLRPGPADAVDHGPPGRAALAADRGPDGHGTRQPGPDRAASPDGRPARDRPPCRGGIARPGRAQATPVDRRDPGHRAHRHGRSRAADPGRLQPPEQRHEVHR